MRLSSCVCGAAGARAQTPEQEQCIQHSVKRSNDQRVRTGATRNRWERRQSERGTKPLIPGAFVPGCGAGTPGTLCTRVPGTRTYFCVLVPPCRRARGQRPHFLPTIRVLYGIAVF